MDYKNYMIKSEKFDQLEARIYSQLNNDYSSELKYEAEQAKSRLDQIQQNVYQMVNLKVPEQETIIVKGQNEERKEKKKTKFEKYREQGDPMLLMQWTIEQNMIKSRLTSTDSFRLQDIKYIAGLDISWLKTDTNRGFVCLSVLSYPDLQVVYHQYKEIRTTVPYIPGFLAFREVPSTLELWNEIKQQNKILPQIILVDGNGILHCNECGQACHLGAIIDVPTIGCSKKIFDVDGLNKNTLGKISSQIKPGSYQNLVGKSGKI